MPRQMAPMGAQPRRSTGHRLRALVVVLMLVTGCASRHVTTIATGPELAEGIRSALTDGEVRSVAVVDGESAFWIGGGALPSEVAAVTRAILAAPTSRRMHDYMRMHPSAHGPRVLRFDSDSVLAFHQPAAVLELCLSVGKEVRFVRVIRQPTGGAPRYDIVMRDAWESHETLAQGLDPSPALGAAWTRLLERARYASTEPQTGSPFRGLRSREPLASGLRVAGVTHLR